MNINIYIYMWMYVCIYFFVCAYVCIYICKYIYVYICVVFTFTYIHIYICIYIDIYIYIYIYIYQFIHIQNIEISFAAALESIALEIDITNGILNDTNHIKSFIDESIDYQFNINKYKKNVRYQIHELKNMAKEIMKNKQKTLKIEQQKSFKLNKNNQQVFIILKL
jgi:hypothetical protein